MSIFNRIFRGGKDDSSSEPDDPPKEDAPTDIEPASSPPHGSPAQGAPLPPSASGGDQRYHPALSYTPPAGVVLSGSEKRSDTESDPEDTETDMKPRLPVPDRAARAPSTGTTASFGTMAGPDRPPAATETKDSAPAQRGGTQPLPTPSAAGVQRRLTPLPPGATTRARSAGKPLRRQTGTGPSAGPGRGRTKTSPPPTPAQAAQGTPNPARRGATPPPRAKTQPGSGISDGSTRPVRARPPTPSAVPAGKSDGKIQSALDGMDTEQLTANVDSAFSGLESGHFGTATETTERDLDSIRELFEDMAADYMLRVRDFMMEVKWGEATPGWAGRCEPVVRSLRRFADKVGYKELSDRLKAYGSELANARRAGGAFINGEPAKALIAAFDALAELTPAIFELDTERDRREPVIVESLLRQVPVHRVGLDKLHAAGLHKLSAFFKARPDDMASLADIAPELAERVVACFAAYKRDSDASLSAADVNAEHRRLKSLVGDLLREHQAYERAARQWSAEALANKRHYRESRRQVMFQIQVCLARLGELDAVKAIERQSFERKLDTLQAYLARQSSLGRRSTSSGGGDEQRP